ncbi:MAG: Hsp70 family protein [Deltaproteobacteria bacterium]|nr:Hsp70 family protein [Deltaproteobacteria bacterium]
MSKTIVGIDLGTTFSLVSVLENGVPRVLPNALGETLTPSAVSLDEQGRVLVGAAARARATTHPEHTALSFKRDMGSDALYSLGGKKFTPIELSALLLKALKAEAEHALGTTIDEAVITVPAYFGDAQRQATRAAGQIAGLQVDRIINEPTAAAMAYGLHERHREFKAVVLDLGGGTFDVTVLEVLEGVIEVQASAGDSRLGGDDFDQALVERLAAQLQAEHGADPLTLPQTRARLREAAEAAKKRLSDADQTLVPLFELAVGKQVVSVELPLHRRDAESAWAPLLERIQAITLRALRDANLKPAQVDEVLLVGGSTRLPCVGRLASQIFGRLPLRKLPPDEAVALGAAVQAGLKQDDAALDDVIVTDIAPFSLGTSTLQRMGGLEARGLFVPLIERGTVIPCSRAKRFVTALDDQTEITVDAYQGEHAMAAQNHKLGEYVVRDVPKGPAGQESVEIRFSYDLNGILEVETTVLSTGKKSALVIEQQPGRLTPEQIAEVREGLARLKFHPQDALPNVAALNRADALYMELVGPARAQLGGLIAHFRAALDSQDGELIRVVRERLVAAVARGR